MGKGSLFGFLGLGRRKLLGLEAFRDRVADGIRVAGPDLGVEPIDEATLLVTYPPSDARETVTISLSRTHGLYLDDPADLDSIIEQLVATVSGEETKATPESLLVLVRPSTYDPPTEDGDQDNRGISRPIAADLLALVAVDTPEGYLFRSASTLRDELGMGNEAIWSRALANLRAILPRFEMPGPKEVGMLIFEDGHASGLLADDDFWRRTDEETPDGILVMAAETNAVFVAGSFDPEALPALDQVSAVAQDSPNFLSSVILTRRDGRWIEAAEIDPAFARVPLKH